MNVKILLIEDDDQTAELLTARLRAAGYQTDIATDAMLGVTTAPDRAPPPLLQMSS